MLKPEKIQAAIRYNRDHASDLLPALRSKLGLNDADFVPAMIEYIAERQAQYGFATIDGMVGGDTRKQIVDDLPLYDATPLWPSPGKDARAHWLALAKAHGVSAPTERSLLIGLRGLALKSSTTHALASRPKYDDTFVWIDSDPSVDVEVFAGATHPYQVDVHGSLGVNVGGSEAKDVATIKPGHYHCIKTTHHGRAALALRTHPDHGPMSDHIPCWRDVDHDRTIAGTDLDYQNLYATGILVHPGFDATRGDDATKRYASVGCQTAALEHVERLCKRAPLDYLLIDVNAYLSTH